MSRDFKIGMLVGLVVIACAVLCISIWPSETVESRLRRGRLSEDQQSSQPLMNDSTAIQNDSDLIAAPGPTESKELRIHIVESGQTLSAISMMYYGNYDYVKEIIRANQKAITNPDYLRAGTRLIIPQ